MNYSEHEISAAAVVVLYNQKWNETNLIPGILRYLSRESAPLKLELVIYDNSPARQEFHSPENLKVEYLHDPANGKLAAAYNYAYEKAKASNKEWLLLLDQDTTLDESFFDQAYKTMLKIKDTKEITAIVPRISGENQVISPCFVSRLGRMHPVSRNFTGVSSRKMTGINSGTFLKISLLDELKGFNRSLPLDMLDHWYFNELYKRGEKIYVFDHTLRHQLSVQDYNKNVSVERYKSIVQAERLFYNRYSDGLTRIFYKLRLSVRTIKQLILVKDKRIPFLSFISLFKK
ncbi:MAG: glycosyltransferase [Eubacteriaceae bacterium]|nr:glycosyltransferase [Eubacteriaceae bacterium]